MLLPNGDEAVTLKGKQSDCRTTGCMLLPADAQYAAEIRDREVDIREPFCLTLLIGKTGLIGLV